MKFVELTKKEFDDFAKNNEQVTFQQSGKWGQFKAGENWHSYFVGMKEKNNIIAASMLLSKENQKQRFFYAPRGFLIDYKNLELLKEFTTKTIAYIKEKSGVLLKIDPNIIYQERNQYGELKEGGINNTFIEENLKEIGFRHVGDDFLRNTIQPRWFYQIILKSKTLDDVMHNMCSKTRQIIRNNEKLGILVHELKPDKLETFCTLIKKITTKYNTINYRLPYYEDFYKAFQDDIKIMIAELNFKITYERLEKEINQLEHEKELRIHNYHETHMKENVFIDKILYFEKKQEKIRKKIKELKKIEEETNQDTLFLGGYFFITYGKEIIAFQGGIEEKWKKFNAAYSIHYHMLKWALENNYDIYNFYEISGNFNKKDPMYGSYHFKKNFGGEVIELLGEFDYPIEQKKYENIKHKFPEYYGVKIIYKNNKK